MDFAFRLDSRLPLEHTKEEAPPTDLVLLPAGMFHPTSGRIDMQPL